MAGDVLTDFIMQCVGRTCQGAAGVSSMSSEGRGDVSVATAEVLGFDLIIGHYTFYTRLDFLLALEPCA